MREIIYPVKAKRPKPVPCPAAHPRIVHMREYTRGNLVKITRQTIVPFILEALYITIFICAVRYIV